jgi:hypothetical protein
MQDNHSLRKLYTPRYVLPWYSQTTGASTFVDLGCDFRQVPAFGIGHQHSLGISQPINRLARPTYGFRGLLG